MSDDGGFAILLGGVLAVAIVLLGYAFVEQNTNDMKCEAALGVGATWDGSGKCISPPILVPGVD